MEPTEHLKNIRIIDTIPLPDGIAGLTDGHTIWLNPVLTTVGWRCTLAHELVHVERGTPPPGLDLKEERKVDRIAARRLTSTEELMEAVVWTQNTENRRILAHELSLDLTMLDIRLQAITDQEMAAINHALDELGEVA